MKYILWKDAEIGKYCMSPVKEDINIQDLVKWLKKEMAGFTYPRVLEEKINRYRGNEVEFIAKNEMIDCFQSGKKIHSFYYDMV